MNAKRYVITLTPEAAAKLEKWLGGPLAISPDVGYGMPDILADLRNENGAVADYNRAEADRRLEARESVRISGLNAITDSEYEPVQERLRRGVTLYHAGGPGAETTETRTWRTLVHVRSIDVVSGFIYVDLPGWISDAVIRVRVSDIPPQVSDRLRIGDRLYARVNLGAERVQDLRFSDWELAEPHEELNDKYRES